jgi:N-terminal domain of anti-restriction factor ArdC
MTTSAIGFAELLRSAVEDPGIVSNAYRQFHAYSVGNQLLALAQCMARGIPPGPLATYPRWRELGRYVRKGEKAITLCRPITVKRTKAGRSAIPPAGWLMSRNRVAGAFAGPRVCQARRRSV